MGGDSYDSYNSCDECAGYQDEIYYLEREIANLDYAKDDLEDFISNIKNILETTANYQPDLLDEIRELKTFYDKYKAIKASAFCNQYGCMIDVMEYSTEELIDRGILP